MSDPNDTQIADRKALADKILERLLRPGSSAITLLSEYKTQAKESQLMWKENPDLYRGFALQLIKEGYPAAALALALERQRIAKAAAPPGTTDSIPEGYPLRYALALAAVRGGNTGYAERLIEPLLTIARLPDPQIEGLPTKLCVEVIALFGRILKDRSRRDSSYVRMSAEVYEEAAKVPGAATLSDGGTYPLINAATMWRLAAYIEQTEEEIARTALQIDEAIAHKELKEAYLAKAANLAAQVVAWVKPRINAAVEAGDHWLPATLGEASILVGQHTDAVDWYTKAVDMARAKNSYGDIVSMGLNLMRLVEAKATEKPEWIEEHIGTVVVFSGHMIDSPERLDKRLKPRFPNSPDLIRQVQRAIRAKLEALNARVGYCSLACGSDILFAEAMLARDAELHIVLPFDQKDFLRTSVDFGLSDDPAMKSWVKRFRQVLESENLPADHIHSATTEPYLGTHQLFEFVNTLTQGLAVLHARQRIGTPKALVVLEQEEEVAIGGTQHFRDLWDQTEFRPTEVIDLSEIRGPNVPMLPRVPPKPLPEPLGAELKRPIKALLFADVAGFSGIKEDRLPRFLNQYAALLKRAFGTDAGNARLFANTWGDGLYMVFEHVPDAAEFALTLLDLAENPGESEGVDWTTFEIEDAGVPIRIALHTGPVYEVPGVFDAQPGYYGQHVNRAARIEPITTPGCAYASEQFAAHLIMTGRLRFSCELVGIQPLAKDYDHCQLYHVTRAIPHETILYTM